MTFYDELRLLLARDEGGRHFSDAPAVSDIEAAAGKMYGAERVMLVTGFPVLDSEGRVCGETDGPPGAADAAAAFLALGRKVMIVSDGAEFPEVAAAARCRAGKAELVCYSGRSEDEAEALVSRFKPDLFIALERPGKANDGHFHSAAGESIDSRLGADTDHLLIAAKKAGAVTVGIGDGGNELGMGSYRAVTEKCVRGGERIASELCADFALASGVSNWWGWGIAALLSLKSGRMLVPSVESEAEVLRATVAAGGVDGVTHMAEESVDSVPMAIQYEILRDVARLTAAELERCKSDAAARLSSLTPAQARHLIRGGGYTRPTAGLCGGYAQCNLVALPEKYAADFLEFARRNPKPCPVLEVTEPGSRRLKNIAKDADVALDIPKYRLYEYGVCTGEFSSVDGLWRDDMVAFLIGCSFSFEEALLKAGLPVRHIEEGRNVPMYDTNIPLEGAGPFFGNTVVSMRPMTPADAERAREITARFPRVHGAPLHMGDPGEIGIKDINAPEYGDSVTIKPGEIPVFWACGVTPQAALMRAKLPFALTHSPGHMFISDRLNTDFAEDR